MRILYVCQDAGIAVFGRKGASTHIREVCRAWIALGHQVHLVCAVLGPDPDLGMGLPVSTVAPVEGKIIGADIRRVLTNRRFARALPVIVREFQPDIIYERHSLYTGAAPAAARRQGIPHILEANALLSDEQSRRLHFPGWAARREARAFRATDCLITVSPGLAAACGRWGIEPEKVHTLPMAVDPDHFAARPRAAETRAAWGWRPDDIILGYLGALTAWHRPDLLLEAAARLVSAHSTLRLLFIGGAPQHIATYRRAAADHGLGNRVMFTDAVPYAQVPALLAEVDIGVVPGAHEWSTPTKIFEYAAMGIPLVAPATENITAVVEDKRSGLLFSPGDAAALADAVARLIRDENLRREIGDAGRRRVLDRHTWRHHTGELLALCQRLIEERQSPQN